MRLVEAPKVPLLGIDLGTTHSLIALLEPEGPKVLQNELGDSLIPSAVALDSQGQLLVGAAALERIRRDEKAGLRRFKTEMGTNKTWTLGEHKLSPIALSAMILRELKELAESQLDTEVENAVITVPAWFKEPQRQATMEAAKLAGLKVQRLINEPTAAALAHGLYGKEEELTLLVIDLGGGTFDVTLMDLYEGVAEVRASTGDTHLGGEDFTDTLYKQLLADLKEPGSGEMWARAEQAKRKLQSQDEVTIKGTNGGATTISRGRFEELNASLIERITTSITEVLVQGKARKDRVQKILLVGGATRMGCIEDLVEKIFRKKALKAQDVDQIVAQGAAIQAGLIAGDRSVKDIVLTDVVAHSLGISIIRDWQGQTLSDRFDPLIHRGTTIPTSRKRPYYTVHHQQSMVTIEVYQGERRVASENDLLGTLEVTDLPTSSDPEERCSFEVRFTHDTNGLLEVEATVTDTKQKVSTVIDRGISLLDEQQKAAAVKALNELKIDQRDLLPNKYLLERAQRIFSVLNEQDKNYLDQPLLAFEAALESGDPKTIKELRASLTQLCNQLSSHFDIQ